MIIDAMMIGPNISDADAMSNYEAFYLAISNRILAGYGSDIDQYYDKANFVLLISRDIFSIDEFRYRWKESFMTNNEKMQILIDLKDSVQMRREVRGLDFRIYIKSRTMI